MNGSQVRSDFGSEEEDDLVHVDDAGECATPRHTFQNGVLPPM